MSRASDQSRARQEAVSVRAAPVRKRYRGGRRQLFYRSLTVAALKDYRSLTVAALIGNGAVTPCGSTDFR